MPVAFQEPVLPVLSAGGELAQRFGQAGALLNGDSLTLPSTLVPSARGDFVSSARSQQCEWEQLIQSSLGYCPSLIIPYISKGCGKCSGTPGKGDL